MHFCVNQNIYLIAKWVCLAFSRSYLNILGNFTGAKCEYAWQIEIGRCSSHNGWYLQNETIMAKEKILEQIFEKFLVKYEHIFLVLSNNITIKTTRKYSTTTVPNLRLPFLTMFEIQYDFFHGVILKLSGNLTWDFV